MPPPTGTFMTERAPVAPPKFIQYTLVPSTASGLGGGVCGSPGSASVMAAPPAIGTFIKAPLPFAPMPSVVK